MRGILADSPQSEFASRARLILEDPACLEEDCAPAFTLVVGDRRLTRDDLRGKVVALYFFASDCYRCDLSYSVLGRLAKSARAAC